MEFVSSAAAAGFISDLEARAANTTAVGFLLRQWLASGASAWSRYDETVEVVISMTRSRNRGTSPGPAFANERQSPGAKRTAEGLSDFGDDA